MNFNDWVTLLELNEAFEEKDEMRIKDIVRKAAGNESKEISLASTMAKVIKDADKAQRRGEAAEAGGLPHLAQIFYDRAAELSGSSQKTDPMSSEEPVENPTPDPKPRPVRKSPPARKQPGDFFKISAKMILEGNKVGLSDGKHWRFITATNTRDRQWQIQSFRAGRYRGRRGYDSGQDATAYIDKEYLEKLGDQAIFYVKASKVSSSWVEGHVHYPNGLESTSYIVRFKLVDAPPNGPEIDIFLAHEKDLAELRGSARFFSGDETFLMNKDGKDYAEEFSPGSYVALSLNHELSVMKGEPVFYVAPHASQSMKNDNVFFVGLSDWLKMEKSITKEKAEVVADYLSKEIGAEVSVKSWSSTGDTTFSIPWFLVVSDRKSGYLSNYEAKPFFSSEAAERHIAELKQRSQTEKLPFSTEDLRTKRCSGYYGEGPYEITFAKLMDYARLVGIEVKLRKFFEEKRGAVASKKFAF